MRDKSLFHLILGLNIALAAAFVVYLILSSHGNPEVTSAQFPVPEPSRPEPAGEAAETDSEASQAPSDTRAAASVGQEPAVPTAPGTNAPAEPTFTDRTFGWKDVETDAYQAYIESLRAVGCPEDKIRYIILSDINELYHQKRMKEAIRHDPAWWKTEPESSVSTLLRDRGLTLDQERRELIARWLGEEVAEEARLDTPYWSHVQLTGPVLGALEPRIHHHVQEICAESMDRYQSIFWSAINSGRPINQVDLANLRQGTRSELVKVLSPEAQEEFLLRYSHNANKLRQELRGFDPTPEEFRKIFRVTDPIDHAMQLQYGSLDSLSPQQKQRHEERRDRQIQEVLDPDRYQQYLLTKDPLYRQAQMMALQHGAPSSAIMPIYQMTKANNTRRQAIMSNTSLTPEQKRQQINAVYVEQQQEVRKIVADARRETRGP